MRRNTMENDVDYTKVTDDSGMDYYCPLSVADNNSPPDERIGDDCVETDVVHRYSGNIRVVR
jgi:hypothetical protein